MKSKIRLRNKIATLAALLTLVLSQSGFMAGVAAIFTPLGLPFLIIGASLPFAGMPMTVSQDEEVRGAGWALFWTGVILDEINPGHVDALNEVPNTKTQQTLMGVTDQDIQNYNERLAGTTIQDAYDKFKSKTALELRTWADQTKTPLKDLSVLGPTLISGEQLKMASAQLNLSQSDAKILLYKVFGTRTVD